MSTTFSRARSCVVFSFFFPYPRRELKRKLVKRRVTPTLVLDSIAADIDVATSWYYWQSDEVQESEDAGVASTALLLALLGTVSWLMHATNGLGWIILSPYCRRGPFPPLSSCSSPSAPSSSSSSPIPPSFFSSLTADSSSSFFPSSSSSGYPKLVWYLPLINTMIEDLPQLVLTFVTSGFDTLEGSLDVMAALFGFLAEVAEAYFTKGDDLPTKFAAVSDSITRPLVEERFVRLCHSMDARKA